jgi:hypothetical protein
VETPEQRREWRKGQKEREEKNKADHEARNQAITRQHREAAAARRKEEGERTPTQSNPNPGLPSQQKPRIPGVYPIY